MPTDDDRVRKVLEPNSPPIGARIETLKRLRSAGIRTWAFIAPTLPMDPRRLHSLVSPHVEYVLIDPLNYQQQVARLFRDQGWAYALSQGYAKHTRNVLQRLFREQAPDLTGLRGYPKWSRNKVRVSDVGFIHTR